MKRSSNAGQRELQWRERIANQAKSGQGIAAWCRDQGVAVQSFYWWKSRLAKPAPSLPKTKHAPFIDLGALRETAPTAGLEIRLDLGSGMMLTIAKR